MDPSSDGKQVKKTLAWAKSRLTRTSCTVIRRRRGSLTSSRRISTRRRASHFGSWISSTFKELPLAGHDISLPYSITPPAISLAVKGPANVVNTLETSREFVVYMDLKGLEPGVYVRRATIVLPVNTLLVGVSPEIFTVTIKGND